MRKSGAQLLVRHLHNLRTNTLTLPQVVFAMARLFIKQSFLHGLSELLTQAYTHTFSIFNFLFSPLIP
ncbi:MAG TPA: hypothetical protein VLE74_02265, partial [Candidatus Saccharimonadales bacterium]|nr:hypothetical protein [Candidatus Saccharimonadales bacterium]